MQKIGFSLPGLYENFIINKLLILTFYEHPEYFNDNIQIDAVFGNFQWCIWDGGRYFDEYNQASLEDIQMIYNFFKQHKIPMRFIYTNTELKPDHLKDRFCNLVTAVCEDELNEIVINSPILEEYLRINYPKYNFISSTTKCLTNQDLVKKELDKDYLRVCLDYNFNHNFNFLNNLTNSQKEKVELLINVVCGPNCQNRIQHYKLNSLYNLNYGKTYQIDYCTLCAPHLLPYDTKVSNEITIDEIKKYVDIGIVHFKLEGRRSEPLTHLISCVKYLIKPEYQFFVIGKIYYEFEKETKK